MSLSSAAAFLPLARKVGARSAIAARRRRGQDPVKVHSSNVLLEYAERGWSKVAIWKRATLRVGSRSKLKVVGPRSITETISNRSLEMSTGRNSGSKNYFARGTLVRYSSEIRALVHSVFFSEVKEQRLLGCKSDVTQSTSKDSRGMHVVIISSIKSVFKARRCKGC